MARVDKPTILVDTREPKRIDGELSALGLTVERVKLDTGDYLWVSRFGAPVVVERKTMADLLSSISGKQSNGSSRAQNQLARLREFPHPVLLVDGYPDVSANGKILRGRTETTWLQGGVDNWLLTVQSSGIRVAYAASGHLATRLEYLVGYYEKKER